MDVPGQKVGKKILLVGYDRISRESLAYLLRGLGHEVREVWSAEDGKAALGAFVPDAAVMDVRLPGLPGDAFAVYLKHKVPSVKIVLLSAEYTAEHVVQFDEGVKFMGKPVDLAKLVEMIGE